MLLDARIIALVTGNARAVLRVIRWCLRLSHWNPFPPTEPPSVIHAAYLRWRRARSDVAANVDHALDHPGGANRAAWLWVLASYPMGLRPIWWIADL